jgi:hypothetical protein
MKFPVVKGAEGGPKMKRLDAALAGSPRREDEIAWPFPMRDGASGARG